MRIVEVLSVASICLAVYGAAASAADSTTQTKSVSQKIVVQVAATNPSLISVSAQGVLLNANLSVGAQSDHCSALVSQIVPSVCVPIGPGTPVSPN